MSTQKSKLTQKNTFESKSTCLSPQKSVQKSFIDQKSAQKSALVSDQLKKVLKNEWVTQKNILDFLCNAQKSELYLSQLTNIGGDIIPWLVSQPGRSRWSPSPPSRPLDGASGPLDRPSGPLGGPSGPLGGPSGPFGGPLVGPSGPLGDV